ncbi:c8ffeb06-9e3e-459c-850f-9367c295d495 [Thermothielavioides terrestris]|uniref:C8ffeb06-9e3e-459c-850f-9367c295d495 n=1 Tax=Thermothielavioides terrestris TaxID=2587410 RepID=A0A3S4EVE4_9PEZI|nr:c8ffeb06-9e3e-459c-850f-9367c295d495 [Thermothielavioides terrestris]
MASSASGAPPARVPPAPIMGRPPSFTSLSPPPPRIQGGTLLPAQSSPFQPRFTGTGTILIDRCAVAHYTLIDYGTLAYYAPFIGCIDSQPDCCPFTPETPVQGTNASVYPQPHDASEAVMNRCPADYYSVSGSCCPNGFTPWTTLLGGETPCHSSVTEDMTPPPITTTINAAASVASKSTVTVSRTVFALQYAVEDDGSRYSPGQIAGIFVGAATGLGLLLGAAILACTYLKAVRNRKREKDLHANFLGPAQGVSDLPASPDAVHRADLVPPPAYSYPVLDPLPMAELPAANTAPVELPATPVAGLVRPPYELPAEDRRIASTPRQPPSTSTTPPRFYRRRSRSAGNANRAGQRDPGSSICNTPVQYYRESSIMPGTATTLTAEQPSPKPVATAAAAELRPRIPRAAVSLAEKPLTLWPIPFLPVPVPLQLPFHHHHHQSSHLPPNLHP